MSKLAIQPIQRHDHEMRLVYDSWVKAYRRTLPFRADQSAGMVQDAINHLLDVGVQLDGVFNQDGECLAWVCRDIEPTNVRPDRYVVHFVYIKSSVKPDSAEIDLIRKLLALPSDGGVYTYFITGMRDLLVYLSGGGKWDFRPKYAALR